MTTKDILIAARNLIEKEENWAKGANAFLVGRACAGSAVDRACGDADFKTAVRPLLEAIRAENTMDLVRWNDAPERTHAEVLAAFDKAIAECA